jgi:hypothetical protein
MLGWKVVEGQQRFAVSGQAIGGFVIFGALFSRKPIHFLFSICHGWGVPAYKVRMGKRFGKNQQMRWSKKGATSCSRLAPEPSTAPFEPSSRAGILG